MADGRLHGRVALITGSDSGIGQATAIEFAKEGADVVVHYLADDEGAEETRRRVEAEGRHAIVAQADIAAEDDVDRLFEAAAEAFGRVDILMNNAGVDASGTEVSELSTEIWDRAIKTNVYGAFFCCRRYLQLFKANGGRGGKIINVTSVHQEIPNPGGADYDCSKGAVRNLTRTLALELAPLRINVNNLGPGWCLRRSTSPPSTTPTSSRNRFRAFPGSERRNRPRSAGSRSSSRQRTAIT